MKIYININKENIRNIENFPSINYRQIYFRERSKLFEGHGHGRAVIHHPNLFQRDPEESSTFLERRSCLRFRSRTERGALRTFLGVRRSRTVPIEFFFFRSKKGP